MPKIYNPTSGELLYEYTYTSKDQFLAALNSLTLEGKPLQKSLSPFKRSQILNKLGQLLQKNKSKLAELISSEMGKLLSEAEAEVDRGIITCTVSSEEAKRIGGDSAAFTQHTEPTSDHYSMTQRFPLGTIFCITPFNFPLNLALHKIGPALAAGNCVLYKPADMNYSFGKYLTSLIYEAGFPKECFHMVLPEVSTLNEVISHPDIDCISFTGGTATANKIASLAGNKKLLFELGGNDPFIICEDADLDKVKKYLIPSRVSVNGQTCTSSKRIFIHESHYSFIKNYLMKELSLMEARPLINEKAAQDIQSKIEAAKSSGAEVLLDGSIKKNLMKPALVDNISSNSALIKEETFGPVFCLISYKSEDEMIKQVNSTAYGLQAGVFTESLEKAKRFFQEIEVGSVGINLPPGFRQEQHPFGGVKSSGNSREGIKYAISEMTFIKQLVW